MGSHFRISSAVGLGVFLTIAASALAQRGAPAPTASVAPSEATARIVAAAQALVTTLDQAGRAKLQFPFDGPQKARWSNLPSGIFQREGLRVGDLTPAQRAAVTNLLQTALSADGYRKVTEIMRGDDVLRQTGGGAPRGGAAGARPGGPPAGARPGGPDPAAGGGQGRGGGRGLGGAVVFGEAEYFLAFVGTPSVTAPWMLQFGGHHLAINLTMGGSQASMTPSGIL